MWSLSLCDVCDLGHCVLYVVWVFGCVWSGSLSLCDLGFCLCVLCVAWVFGCVWSGSLVVCGLCLCVIWVFVSVCCAWPGSLCVIWVFVRWSGYLSACDVCGLGFVSVWSESLLCVV